MAEEKLFDAARRGQAEDVEEVIREHPQLLQFHDRWGLTALHSAAVAGCANVIAVLLDYQAAVDGTSRSGQTALHFAAREGRGDAVAALIQRTADVSRRTAHGILPIELATSSGCAELIRQEAARRIKVVEDDISTLQERLSCALAAKELLEVQLQEPAQSCTSTSVLGSEQGILAPQNGSQQATQALAEAAEIVDRGPKEGYWRRAAAWLSVQRFRGRAALHGSFMRQTSGDVDGSPFPWTGPLISEHPLPHFDPEDEELPASFARLKLVSEEHRARKSGASGAGPKALEEDQSLDQEILGLALEMAVDEKTGRSPEEWEEVVSALNAPDATWDWSKVEVRRVEPRRRRGLCVALGVFAVAPPSTPEAPQEEPEEAEGERERVEPPPAVVFHAGDLIGPVGGVLRRKKRYMADHYGDELWFFHDPFAHELPLRIQSTELRTEPMVIDQELEGNRLRYLRDQREDPLDMSELLPQSYEESTTDFSQTSDAPLWPKRAAMTRINSRSLPPPPPSAASRGPASPLSPSAASRGPESPTAMTSTMSSWAEMEMQPMEANCKIVDVHVHGWPYSFVVATSTICHDEELFIDRGEEFWERQRSVLERLRSLAPGLGDILTGVTLPEPSAPDPAGAFPPRTPHARPSSKPTERWSAA